METTSTNSCFLLERLIWFNRTCGWVVMWSCGSVVGKWTPEYAHRLAYTHRRRRTQLLPHPRPARRLRAVSQLRAVAACVTQLPSLPLSLTTRPLFESHALRRLRPLIWGEVLVVGESSMCGSFSRVESCALRGVFGVRVCACARLLPGPALCHSHVESPSKVCLEAANTRSRKDV